MKFSKWATTSAFALLSQIPALAQSDVPAPTVGLTASNACGYLSPDCSAHTEGLKLRVPTRNWGTFILSAENFRERQGEHYINNKQASHPAVGSVSADADWSAQVKGQRVTAELMFQPSKNTSFSVGAYAGQATGIMTQHENAQANLQLQPQAVGLSDVATNGVATGPLVDRVTPLIPQLSQALGQPLSPEVLAKLPDRLKVPAVLFAPYSAAYDHAARREAKSLFGGVTQGFEYAPSVTDHLNLRLGQSLRGGVEGATVKAGVGFTYRTRATADLMTTPNGACNGDPGTPSHGGAVTVAFCASKMVYAPLYKRMEQKADHYADRFNDMVAKALKNDKVQKAQEEGMPPVDAVVPKLTGQQLFDIMKVKDPRATVPSLDVGYGYRRGNWSAQVGVSVPLKTSLKKDTTANASLSYSFR